MRKEEKYTLKEKKKKKIKASRKMRVAGILA